MSDRQWVIIRSSHAVRLDSDRVGHVITICGRRVGDMTNRPETFDILPSGKSCESCLRIIARQDDTP